MSKKLEEFIKTNKKDFDLEMPAGDLWGKIEKELDKKKPGKSFRLPVWIGIAASVAIVLGILFFYTSHQKRDNAELAGVSPAYAQKEIRYASMIEEKRDSLQLFAKENPVLYNRFSSDLNALNSDYINLKKELKNSPNQKLVIKAMVKNLELQLQVINQQLSIINEVSQFKTQSQI